jgi:coniferyl-aldehyde dehydrogenase
MTAFHSDTAPSTGEAFGNERVDALFSAQRIAFDAAPYPDLEARRAALRRLRKVIRSGAVRCAEAAEADFGVRASAETMLLELMPSLLHIDHLLRNLRSWMKPSRRHTELLFRTNRALVQYQPKGLVGIVASWNAPFYLTFGPLATAIASGNRCLVKTSEYAPNASSAMRELLGEAFDERTVAVVEGDARCAMYFCSLPFDHIVFTGSSAVGRHVMRAAAENLTPVTLELGGKSPAIVSRSADLAKAARRIVHGKVANGGQICVSPDYALVPKEDVAKFIAAAAAAYREFEGNAAQRTWMIHERAYERMNQLLDDAHERDANVIRLGEPVPGTRQFPLSIVTGVKPEMRLAQEEIFGPILPIIPYDSIDDAIGHIRHGSRPLALYWFGSDSRESTRLLRETHSGGVTMNDWGWHVLNHDLPFGGSGTSGMGSYHGVEGFRELSHAKSVFAEHRWFPIELFHPPYGRWAHRLVLRFYFGAEVADIAARKGSQTPEPASKQERVGTRV